MASIRRAAIAGVTVVVCASVCKLGAIPPKTKHPDFVAQIVTVSAMRSISQEVSHYMTEHQGAAPNTLEELRLAYDLPAKWFRDGWGRPFSFFTTGQSYVLASFGKSGSPESQRASPGGVVQELDYESDIVIVDGKWAQTPLDVDQ